MIKPSYYHKGNIDVIEFARQSLGIEKAKGFCQINIIKYVVRYQEKNGIEDLEKARTYLARLKELESLTNEPTNKSE